MTAELSGVRDLTLAIQKTVKQLEANKQKALAEAGMQIVADAQENIRTAGHGGGTLTTTGQLSQSGKTQKAQDGSIEAGFFAKGGAQGHAAVVEYGSTKSWWPPVAYLRQWAKKKLRLDEKDAKRAAYFIGLTIAGKNPRKPGVHGLRPHPFFTPAVKKNEKRISEIIGKRIWNAIDNK